MSIRHTNLFRALMALALLVIMASCNKDDNALLSTVPSSATTVGIANLSAIVDECRDVLEKSEGDMLQKFDELRKGMDLTNVVFFTDAVGGVPNTMVVTAILKDSEAPAKALAEMGCSVESRDGYNVANIPGLNKSVVWRDKQIWILSSANAVAAVTKLLESASKMSYATFYGVKNFLETSGHLVTLSTGTHQLLQEEDGMEEGIFACMALDTEGSALQLNCQTMLADGTPHAVKGLQTLSTDFLRYVPDSFLSAFAVGLTKEVDWDGIMEVVQSFNDFKLTGLMQTLMPILKNIDGTVSVAAGPMGDVSWMTPTKWSYIGMAHMPQAVADNALSMISSYCAMAGATESVDKEGHRTIVLSPELTLYAGVYDGYLAVANFPISADHSNSFTTTFLNRDAAATFTLPSLAWLSPSAGYGLKLTMQATSDNTRIELSLIGVSTPIIPTLLRALEGV